MTTSGPATSPADFHAALEEMFKDVEASEDAATDDVIDIFSHKCHTRNPFDPQ